MELIRPKDGLAPYRIQSVYDALRLLELVAMSPDPVTASQAAAELGERRNRVFRLLRTIEECGYVVQNPVTRAYQPSLKLVSLGHAVSRRRNLERLARPIMERLREQTGETVYLVARDGHEAICLANLESSHMMRIFAQPGSRWPLGRGAAGQALLLGMPDVERTEFIKSNPALQSRVEPIARQFERDGVITVDGSDSTISEPGVAAFAVPVRDDLGRYSLALALGWPAARPNADTNAFRAALLEARGELERTLGSRAQDALTP